MNITDPPKKIYLQCFDEFGSYEPDGLDTTWCIDQLNKNDAIYVLADNQPERNIYEVEK